MTSTDALITLAELLIVVLVAWIACWIGDRRLQRKQQDWRGESGMRAQR